MFYFSENEALNGTEDLALPSRHIHPRFYPFSSLTLHGREQGEDSPLSPAPVSSGRSCSRPLSEAVPRHHVLPLGWKAVTAGEQGQAAGPGKLQVRGGFVFVQAIRKGALVAQRELKTSP